MRRKALAGSCWPSPSRPRRLRPRRRPACGRRRSRPPPSRSRGATARATRRATSCGPARGAMRLRAEHAHGDRHEAPARHGLRVPRARLPRAARARRGRGRWCGSRATPAASARPSSAAARCSRPRARGTATSAPTPVDRVLGRLHRGVAGGPSRAPRPRRERAVLRPAVDARAGDAGEDDGADQLRHGRRRLLRRVRSRADADPARCADRGLGRARARSRRRRPARDRAPAGHLPAVRAVQRRADDRPGSGCRRAPSTTCRRRRCGRPAGRRPTPPACRCSPACCATTRRRRARSGTRSGSRCSGRSAPT